MGTNQYPKTWKWDDDGTSLEGVLVGLKYAKSKFSDDPVPVITLKSSGENVSVWLPGGLLRRVSDESQKYGDIIKIVRGELVPFGNEGRTYREWDVAVVRKQGEYADLYSKYDDDGLPTHDKAGEELATAQRKKLAKTQAAQKKEHDKFLAKAAADQLGKTTI